MNSLPRADTTDRIYEVEFLTTTWSSCLLPTFFLLSVILIDYFSGNSTAEKKKHPCEKRKQVLGKKPEEFSLEQNQLIEGYFVKHLVPYGPHPTSAEAKIFLGRYPTQFQNKNNYRQIQDKVS